MCFVIFFFSRRFICDYKVFRFGLLFFVIKFVIFEVVDVNKFSDDRFVIFFIFVLLCVMWCDVYVFKIVLGVGWCRRRFFFRG